MTDHSDSSKKGSSAESGKRRKQPPRFLPEEARALSDVRTGALLATVALLLNLVLLVSGLSPEFVFSPTVNPPPVALLDVAIGLLIVEASLGIAAILLYRWGFVRLRSLSKAFATPAQLSLLALAAGVVALLTVVPLMVLVIEAVNCAGAGQPIPSSCVSSAIVSLGTGVALAALLLIVGGIAILVGFWRIGARYSEPLFQVGAVLQIIPYAGWAGSLCIFIGASRVRGREITQAPPASAKDADKKADDQDDDEDEDDN